MDFTQQEGWITFFAIWRALVVVSALFCAGLLALTLRRLPGGMANASRMLIIGHFALMGSAAWASIENVVTHAGATPRLVFSTFGILMTLGALRRFKKDTEEASLQGKEWHSGGFS